MERPRTYRTLLPLRIAVAVAACFWAVVLVVLARAGIEPRLAVGSGLFALFFAVFSVIYGRWSITVTDEGIVVSTPFRRRPFRFEDILQIVVQEGLGGRVYAIVTRRGRVYFTSLFARHRELFELLLDRAGLGPIPA